MSLQSSEGEEEGWGKHTWSSLQLAAGIPRIAISSHWWLYPQHWRMLVGSDFTSSQLSSQADRSSAQSHPQCCTSLRGCWIYEPIFSCGSVEMLDHSLVPAFFSATRKQMENVTTWGGFSVVGPVIAVSWGAPKSAEHLLGVACYPQKQCPFLTVSVIREHCHCWHTEAVTYSHHLQRRQVTLRSGAADKVNSLV